MILCIDTKSMKCAYEVQKNIKLEELLTKHTKYFDSVEEAVKENHVPLDFAVSVRTVYTNKVMQIDRGDACLYYTNLSEIQKFIHKGIDLIMYLASIGLLHSVDYRFGFDECMSKYSTFQCIGLYNPDPDVLNPIVYSHIIISDEGAEELQTFFKEEVSFVPIESIKRQGNVPALLDEFIILNEEDEENAEHDNN